ncbi:hypothetical protein HY572_00940 [Candidatus Micrarchaeota archaeon]|nr:hypothetical protein [Candidatus Micrarchaeota archaeon]
MGFLPGGSVFTPDNVTLETTAGGSSRVKGGTANQLLATNGSSLAAWAAMALGHVPTGLFTADATGRGKFASSFVDSGLLGDNQVLLSKLPVGVFTADATGRGKFGNGFVNEVLCAISSPTAAQVGGLGLPNVANALKYRVNMRMVAPAARIAHVDGTVLGSAPSTDNQGAGSTNVQSQAVAYARMASTRSGANNKTQLIWPIGASVTELWAKFSIRASVVDANMEAGIYFTESATADITGAYPKSAFGINIASAGFRLQTTSAAGAATNHATGAAVGTAFNTFEVYWKAGVEFSYWQNLPAHAATGGPTLTTTNTGPASVAGFGLYCAGFVDRTINIDLGTPLLVDGVV